MSSKLMVKLVFLIVIVLSLHHDSLIAMILRGVLKGRVVGEVVVLGIPLAPALHVLLMLPVVHNCRMVNTILKVAFMKLMYPCNLQQFISWHL